MAQASPQSLSSSRYRMFPRRTRPARVGPKAPSPLRVYRGEVTARATGEALEGCESGGLEASVPRGVGSLLLKGSSRGLEASVPLVSFKLSTGRVSNSLSIEHDSGMLGLLSGERSPKMMEVFISVGWLWMLIGSSGHWLLGSPPLGWEFLLGSLSLERSSRMMDAFISVRWL